MPRPSSTLRDPNFLEAALEGLLLQKERIEAQIREVRELLGKRRTEGEPEPEAPPAEPGRRQLSEAARKRIAAAQKRRWAEYRRQHGEG